MAHRNTPGALQSYFNFPSLGHKIKETPGNTNINRLVISTLFELSANGNSVLLQSPNLALMKRARDWNSNRPAPHHFVHVWPQPKHPMPTNFSLFICKMESWYLSAKIGNRKPLTHTGHIVVPNKIANRQNRKVSCMRYTQVPMMLRKNCSEILGRWKCEKNVKLTQLFNHFMYPTLQVTS